MDAWNNLPLITFVHIQSDGTGTDADGRQKAGDGDAEQVVAVYAHLFKRREQGARVGLVSVAWR